TGGIGVPAGRVSPISICTPFVQNTKTSWSSPGTVHDTSSADPAGSVREATTSSLATFEPVTCSGAERTSASLGGEGRGDETSLITLVPSLNEAPPCSNWGAQSAGTCTAHDEPGSRNGMSDGAADPLGAAVLGDPTEGSARPVLPDALEPVDSGESPAPAQPRTPRTTQAVNATVAQARCVGFAIPSATLLLDHQASRSVRLNVVRPQPGEATEPATLIQRRRARPRMRSVRVDRSSSYRSATSRARH